MKKIIGYFAAASAACFTLFLISICPADAFQVPDTGITECYDAAGNQLNPCPGPGEDYYGQDGNLIHNGMSFTDNADGTLTDNVTDLLWQQAASATAQTWSQAVSSCDALNAAALGGHTSGWRLPDLVELHSIMDLSQTTGAAAIDPVFTGTQAAAYWTSTEDADDSANAWILDFGTTEDGIAAKASTKYVRCVWEVAP